MPGGAASCAEHVDDDAVDEAGVAAQQPRRVGLSVEGGAKHVAALPQFVAPALREQHRRRGRVGRGSVGARRHVSFYAGGGVPAEVVSTS